MRIAIDTGGTFTDCVYAAEGRLRVLKLPSTPANPARAVLDAVGRIAHGEAAEIRHGTTVGTNALLERKGARVAFVTTAGFEDTIAIGRQARPKLYDLFFTKEPPLAPDEMRFGVAERVASDGSVLRAVDEAELRALVGAIRDKAPESIAISLLFSFANPANEQAVAAALRELGVPVSVSHEVLPEFREYERGSTVLINAYLAPKMQMYLERLDRGVRAQGSHLHVMQSSGGIIPAGVAAREPVRTILSGPAGGVVGALAVARAAGFSRILTFDMGGTSTDVALVEVETGLRTTSEFQIMGMPVAVPMLDIHTVGAGGGSIASFDRGGALKVGPQSAGAEPGPICYGRGERPTVTDANLLLGRLDAGGFLGGAMKLDEARTWEYFERAKGALESAEAFAEGIVRVADSHMEKALRKISVEQGRDPRDFVLLSFGGAGPLHACALARALAIPKVLVPMHPGALSAYGILVSDVVRDYSRTVMLKPGDWAIARHLAELAASDRDGVGFSSVDLRYAGQGYELNVPWKDGFAEDFHRLHEQRYGYADRKRPVEVVNARVRKIVATERMEAQREALGDGDGRQAMAGQGMYQRSRLRAGDRFAGPAVIVEYSATTYVPADARVRVDEFANLVISL
ncbi:MAG TPA: hydantoinase/oxoprolinase family protein [Bryobacteraceae bacterium]|jgi:N-methylhydantoinase A|nr:hydantoinase/oxoprolinase family protein [Bryobacteraceae bacterium]